MTIATRGSRQSFRFRGRNFLALVLKPELPVAGWLADLDQWLERSPEFFSGKPLILDLAGVSLPRPEIASLIAELGGRQIRILGIEGIDPSALDETLPPLLTGGRTAGSVEAINATARPPQAAEPETARPAATSHSAPQVPSLLVEAPVRSGQTITNPDGDVIILGSVASGAEVVAAGSIHVYGSLRGRALAGAYGNESARVFCRRFEAELIAVSGNYLLAQDAESRLRDLPVQVWLSGKTLKVAPLDPADKEIGKWERS